MARRGMNDKAGRLVDNDEVRILIGDIETHCFARGSRIAQRRNDDLNLGTRFDPVAGLHYGPPVDLHAAFGDQTLKARAAHVIEMLAENPVEAGACFGLAYLDRQIGRGGHMAKISEAPAPLAAQSGAEQDPPNVRVLKYVVIFLGVLLIGCFIAVFAVIGYRLANPSKQGAEAAVNELDVAIGTAVQLGQIVVEGDRMTVHLKGAAHDELLHIDARRGRVISRIRLRRSAQQF